MSIKENLTDILEECPYVTHHLAGDETWDTYEMAGDRCMLETQGACPFWDELRGER